MHDWSEESVDWEGINAAASYIGLWLRKWARMQVRDYKEKYGTVRVYCSFGWNEFHDIVYPGYCWYRQYWPVALDHFLSYKTPLMRWINLLVYPIHKYLYVWRYKKAVQKWPHLYREIVSAADWGKLFEGKIPGYKHSDFWEEF